jgi:hypothetical protein
MAKISGLVWAEFSHEQLVSWQFSMGKSDRLLVNPESTEHNCSVLSV